MITVLGSLSRRRKLFPSTAIGTSVLHVVRAIVAVVTTAVIRGNHVSRREEKRGDEEHDGGVGGDHVSRCIGRRCSDVGSATKQIRSRPLALIT